MSTALSLLAGFVCGVISGFGIGGGTLLVVYMTLLSGLDQRAAQGINLLYFLPTAAAALILHSKNRLVSWRVTLPAALAGCVTAALSAWLAAQLDTGLLKKLFGGFLILVGLSELFHRKKKEGTAPDAPSRDG